MACTMAMGSSSDNAQLQTRAEPLGAESLAQLAKVVLDSEPGRRSVLMKVIVMMTVIVVMVMVKTMELLVLLVLGLRSPKVEGLGGEAELIDDFLAAADLVGDAVVMGDVNIHVVIVPRESIWMASKGRGGSVVLCRLERGVDSNTTATGRAQRERRCGFSNVERIGHIAVVVVSVGGGGDRGAEGAAGGGVRAEEEERAGRVGEAKVVFFGVVLCLGSARFFGRNCSIHRVVEGSGGGGAPAKMGRVGELPAGSSALVTHSR